MFARMRDLPAGSTQRECDWSRVMRLLLVRRRLVTALLALKARERSRENSWRERHCSVRTDRQE